MTHFAKYVGKKVIKPKGLYPVHVVVYSVASSARINAVQDPNFMAPLIFQGLDISAGVMANLCHLATHLPSRARRLSMFAVPAARRHKRVGSVNANPVYM